MHLVLWIVIFVKPSWMIYLMILSNAMIELLILILSVIIISEMRQDKEPSGIIQIITNKNSHASIVLFTCLLAHKVIIHWQYYMK